MDEKLILIVCEEEVIASFVKTYSGLGAHFYCVENGLEFVEALEFCAFVYIIVKRKGEK